ncbi:MAG: hypothetical protein KGL19_14680 [Bacteroidota bacterium]|nr:hypothetical protein [Bacteroidota bacterium]
MRNTFLLIAILFSLQAAAQNNILNIQPPKVSINLNKNTIDQMSNAMKGIVLRSGKIGNNGQGFDLYKSEPDNMIALKPDNTFHESIPNAMDDYKLNAVSPFLLKQLNEHKNEFPLQNNNEEYHFKLLKPETNKSFLDSTQRKIIPVTPSLQR